MQFPMFSRLALCLSTCKLFAVHEWCLYTVVIKFSQKWKSQLIWFRNHDGSSLLLLFIHSFIQHISLIVTPCRQYVYLKHWCVCIRLHRFTSCKIFTAVRCSDLVFSRVGMKLWVICRSAISCWKYAYCVPVFFWTKAQNYYLFTSVNQLCYEGTWVCNSCSIYGLKHANLSDDVLNKKCVLFSSIHECGQTQTLKIFTVMWPQEQTASDFTGVNCACLSMVIVCQQTMFGLLLTPHNCCIQQMLQ
jgi:hypothetical protein